MKQNSVYDDAIDISEMIQVLKKRRKTVLSVVLAVFICSFVYVLIRPEMYTVSMIVEPSSIYGEDQTQEMSPVNLAEKIKRGAFTSDVMNMLPSKFKDRALSFHINYPKGSTFIIIGLNVKEGQELFGKEALSMLFKRIQQDYEKDVQTQRKKLEKKIKTVENSIDQKKDELVISSKNMQLLDVSKEDLLKVLNETQKNTKDLMKKRDEFIEKTSKETVVPSMLYANVIQQNIAYSNTINDRILTIKKEKETIRYNIKNINREISELSMDLEKLRSQDQNFHKIMYVREPERSLKPIGKSGRTILFMAILGGVLLACLIVFFQEALEKEKK